MTLDHPGPMSKLGYKRCKRFALYLEDGVIRLAKVSEQGPMGEEGMPPPSICPSATIAGGAGFGVHVSHLDA